MRVVVQRCQHACVRADGEVTGAIGRGLVLLVGVRRGDTVADCQYMADKVAHLRVFEDEEGKMNLDVCAVGGAILSVSQFTLYGDVRKGRRPNFTEAAPPAEALLLYEQLNDCLRGYGLSVATGRFGARMAVELVNDGPVTLLLDSQRLF